MSGYDEKGAEDDKGKAEAILDQEEMEIIVLRVCEKEVDVIVGNVEKDETGKEKGGPARWGSLATLSEGETENTEEEGEQRAQDSRDVDGEVDGDGLPGWPDDTEADVRAHQ